MMFNKDVQADTWKRIMEFWGLTEVKEHFQYLDLPPLVGKAQTKTFFEMKSKVQHKLQVQKEKLLSQGRRKF